MSKVSMKLAAWMYVRCMKTFKRWGKRLKILRLCFRKMLPHHGAAEHRVCACNPKETDWALHQSHLILMQSFDTWPINYLLPQTDTCADSNKKSTYSCLFQLISNFFIEDNLAPLYPMWPAARMLYISYEGIYLEKHLHVNLK